MTLLDRLKKRRLIQWTLAYLAGAWLVLEVFSTLQQGLGWPQRLFPFVLGALGVGLGVAVVVAWYHGEQGRQRVSGAELLIITGLFLVAGLLVANLSPSRQERAGGRLEPTSTAAPDEAVELSIAVLPFANRSEREEDAHFVDGIHDEVLLQLGKIRSLQVKSLTSVLEYRDSPKDLPTIGEELGARYIVEGGVRRGGGTIRISLTLREASSEQQLWSASYDRDLTVADVLDVQREIALQVATSLGAEVLPEDRLLLEVDPPRSLLAYDQYLEGLYHYRFITLGLGERTRARRLAIEHLEASIEADPEWAPSRAALGGVYHWTPDMGEGVDAEFARSEASLQAALAIDSLYAPAWNSLGYVRHNWRRDFLGAERAYRRAFALGFGDRHGYALLLTSWGRFEEAIAAFERSTEFNPRSASFRANQGFARACAGDVEGAVVDFDAGREMGWRSPYRGRAEAYVRAGRREEGFAEAEAMKQAAQVSTAWQAALYALADSTQRAQELLAQAEALGEPVRVDHARVASLLGDREGALTYLDRIRTPGLWALCFAEIRSLAGDPRYEAFLDRVGIPRGEGESA